MNEQSIVKPSAILILERAQGNGGSLEIYGEASPETLYNYSDSLKANGFSVLAENRIGENLYVTLCDGKTYLHVGYSAYNRTLRVSNDPMDRALLPTDQTDCGEAVADTTLAVFALDYSHREVTDGNGMCYVVILEDGRYLIIDGGYRNDANRLFNFLVDNNRRKDRRIVVAAWFFTHAHGDHYGAFLSFTDRYADRVTVERAVFNPTTSECFENGNGYGPFFTDEIGKYLSKYGEVKQITPHAGQILRLGDVEMEVYYTHEDCAPDFLPYMNDSSTVVRMTAKGQTVFFPGDCEKFTSTLISALHGKALKSDFLQINHHGYSGGTVELYELVNPDYAMWPTSRDAFELRVTGNRYQWIGNALGSNCYIYGKVGREGCIIADNGVQMITFPLRSATEITCYTPDDSVRDEK